MGSHKVQSGLAGAEGRVDGWPYRGSSLVVRRLAVEVAAEVCRLVGTVPPVLRSQQEQAVKAVARIPLAIAEGQGRTGRDALHLYRIAYSTAKETSAVVELLVALDAVEAAAGRVALVKLDRVQAMTWGLIRRGGR